MNNVRKIELVFRGFSRVSEGLHFFHMTSVSSSLINDLKPKPLQVTKLSLVNSSSGEASTERYYSLLNNPKVSSSGMVDFKFLIRDNKDVSKTANCFPLRLRELSSQDFLFVSFPFGNTSYEGGGVFKFKSIIIRPRLLILISFGTGAVPIAQLIDSLVGEKHDRDLKVIAYQCERADENIFENCLGESYSKLVDYNEVNLSIKHNRYESMNNLISKLDDHLTLVNISLEQTFFIISGSNTAKTQLLSHLELKWRVADSNLSCLF